MQRPDGPRTRGEILDELPLLVGGTGALIADDGSVVVLGPCSVCVSS